MRRIERFIRDAWLELTLGFALTGWAMTYSAQARGYFAIGGEYLILPGILSIGSIVREAIRALRS